MLAAGLYVALLIQNPRLTIWQGSPPKKEWPLFQGHKPVVPPKLSGIRSWVYSFPGEFDAVVQSLRSKTASRFTEFFPLGLEPRIYWDSFARATEFSTGAVTVNYLTYDNSYTVLENCKVQSLKSFKLINDKTATKKKGWITVIRNEPNPDIWHNEENPRFEAAKGMSGEKKLPIPNQSSWPTFFGAKPIAVSDSDVGNVRYWYYTFRASWDDLTQFAKDELGPKGYIFGVQLEHGLTCRRGMFSQISIVLDDDSYHFYKDSRGVEMHAGGPPHESQSPGWVFLVRAEPVSGPNLDFANRKVPATPNEIHNR